MKKKFFYIRANEKGIQYGQSAVDCMSSRFFRLLTIHFSNKLFFFDFINGQQMLNVFHFENKQFKFNKTFRFGFFLLIYVVCCIEWYLLVYRHSHNIMRLCKKVFFIVSRIVLLQYSCLCGI